LLNLAVINNEEQRRETIWSSSAQPRYVVYEINGEKERDRQIQIILQSEEV
jgi:hypothetical protein